ncbi:MAG: PqqD family protein [Oscillospiraceae bacterium]|nr:PqqD family protein [Oscillospiraceae bacterium]
MKIKNGFVLRQVAGQTVVLPADSALDLNMMITLNETGAFLWERLQNDTDEAALVVALLEEYDVDEETAKQSVQAFVKKLSDNEFLC